MPEKRMSKAKKVVYRRRHKSLVHLTAEDTKHAFEERLQGAIQRQESEPVYFGVSLLSDQETHSKLEIFQTVTQTNYQEAAKQRATRSRLRHLAPSRLRPGKMSSQEQFRRVDCSRRTHLRERTSADCPPDSGPPVQEEMQYAGSAQSMSAFFEPSHSSPFPVSDATKGFPTFPAYSNPTTTTSPHPTFTDPALPPNGVFMEENGISGLSINRSNSPFNQFPQPALENFQETCQEGPFHPYWNQHGADPPSYDLPTEAYDSNFGFPIINNSFQPSGRYINLHKDWFSG